MSNDPSTPRWEPDEADEAYTLISGDIRCRIWRTETTWAAHVHLEKHTAVGHGFKKTEEAQAWCERIVAARRASSR